jgi:hypothetical protein
MLKRLHDGAGHVLRRATRLLDSVVVFTHARTPCPLISQDAGEQDECLIVRVHVPQLMTLFLQLCHPLEDILVASIAISTTPLAISDSLFALQLLLFRPAEDGLDTFGVKSSQHFVVSIVEPWARARLPRSEAACIIAAGPRGRPVRLAHRP